VFLSDLLLNVGVYPRKVSAADKLIPAKLQIERDAAVIHRVAAQPVPQFPGLHAQLCGGFGYGQAVAHLNETRLAATCRVAAFPLQRGRSRRTPSQGSRWVSGQTLSRAPTDSIRCMAARNPNTPNRVHRAFCGIRPIFQPASSVIVLWCGGGGQLFDFLF
jgi:hypothetical protein